MSSSTSSPAPRGPSKTPLASSPLLRSAYDRLSSRGVRALADHELLTLVVGAVPRRAGPGKAAHRLLAAESIASLAWCTPAELEVAAGVGPSRAAALAAAFELGRRGAWAPPKRGERVLDPNRVWDLMRDVAHGEREEFHVVLLDVRGRLIKPARIAEGSLSQCPVSPRDVFREVVRAAAHSVVFVHNHPSGDPAPSTEDVDLTDRLRAASEIIGVLARDHVIVAAGGYFSFVEAGRWRRA